MIYFKLPPRKCDDCNYHASGGAFKKTFGRWWWGKEKCPKCGSYNIIDYTFKGNPPTLNIKRKETWNAQ